MSIPETPTIINPGPAPNREMGDEAFEPAANAFFGKLPQFSEDLQSSLTWAALVFDATDQARQQAEEAQRQAEQRAEDAASDAATAQQQAQAADTLRDQTQTLRNEAEFWANQAAGELDMPALSGNEGYVLTVDDDEGGFSWQAPTTAVEVALSSAAQTAATFSWEVSASGVSRHAGGSIAFFIVRWWDGVTQQFTATAGSATLSRTVDEPIGSTVTAKAWAYDDAGNRSRPQTISAEVVGNRPPVGPITINAPTQAAKNSVFQVSLSGASDPDGDPITYQITDAGGLSFAKMTGITAGEIIDVTAPDVTDDTDAAFSVRAVDDKGAATSTYTKTVTVLAAQVMGVALRATGGPGGTWDHVDDTGATIATPSASWFNAHPIFGGMQDVTVDGQAMVEVPKFYVRRGTAGGDPAWWISDQPLAGYEVHPAFLLDGVEVPAFQYGKYQASLSGGKLQSVPGVTPTASRSLTQFLADAEARNVGGVAGFRLHHYDMWTAIQWLYLVENATMDSQTKTGQGRVNESSAAAVDAADVAQATYRGIVGLWGNVYQWMDGARTLNSVIERRDYNGAWQSTGESVPNAGAATYPITFRNSAPLEFIPDTYSTSNDSTATLPDYVRWRDAGEYYPCVGGSWGSGAIAGLWYVYCNGSASYSGSYIGARLARVVS